MLTLYNVISADGFIAREDGSEDFIPDDLWQNFLSLCKEYGTLIMGRKTYDTIQAYDKELRDSFESLPIQKIVISNNKNLNLINGYKIANSPEDALALAPDALVSSGPNLNNYLIKNHLVKEIILYEVSVSIMNGIEPFDKNLLEGINIRKVKLN